LKKSKKYKEYYCWACDYSEITGEGNLARLYIKKNYNKTRYLIYTVETIFSNTTIIKILNYKYISPFLGVIFCWYYFIKNKKVIYINYLPLWNSILFILLPPKTIMGPITGGANYSYGKHFLIRKFFFPILYKISNTFLNFRNVKKIFSTDLLEKFLFKTTIDSSKFNFIFNYINKKKKIKKNLDFLIYYKKHKNKENLFPYDFIKMLSKNKFKIHVFGDYLKMPNINNFGNLKNYEVQDKLAKTKYTIASGENFYSMYSIECINNHVKILVELKFKKQINYYKNNFLFLDFKKNLTKKNLYNLK
jgi:hypothetical protein